MKDVSPSGASDSPHKTSSKKGLKMVYKGLSDLVVYTKPVLFAGYHHAATHGGPTHMSSYGENRIFAIALNRAKALAHAAHNTQRLSRT